MSKMFPKTDTELKKNQMADNSPAPRIQTRQVVISNASKLETDFALSLHSSEQGISK